MDNIFDDYIDDDDSLDEEVKLSLTEKKISEEIRKLKIQNEKELNNLVEKKMVIAVLGQIGQEIRTSFVDMPRRESEFIAAKLGIPEKVKDLELLWSEINSNALDSMKAQVESLQNNEIWE